MEHRSHVRSTFFPLFFSLIFNLGLAIAQSDSVNNSVALFHVGVILDMETWSGKMMMSYISMAISDFYGSHNYSTRLVLHLRDSKRDVIGAASAALDLLKNVPVQAIIGPQTSEQAKFVEKLGDKAHVPIISSSATSPYLSSIETPYFIRATVSDALQARVIASIVQLFKWREVTLICEDTEYGRGIIPHLIDALQEVDTSVPFRSAISVSATEDQMLEELYKLATTQTRVFIVHMGSLGSRFFPLVKKAGMMSEGNAWITTDSVMNLLDSMNSSVVDSMQGVLGLKHYVPESKLLDDFMSRWKREKYKDNLNNERLEPSIFGLWAYDTVTALAMAADRIGAADAHFQLQETGESSTELSTIEVSKTGPVLLKAILSTRFKGLNGEFHLVNRELQSSIFQIVNVIGKGEGELGFWTEKYGISRVLNPGTKKTKPSSVDDLRPIIWPGEVTVVPKGWEIPTSGKRLKIGVPVKMGFHEFVKVERDAHTNDTTISGFCIDLFAAVIDMLPYSVPYELVPYQRADGRSAGRYGQLVYQVYLQKFDAVVGDITIRAKRSQYVDFTLPYMESGLAMLVPIKKDMSTSAWIFMKPLTANLWLTTGFSFVFTGFVIWVLEHPINDDFRGSIMQQLGVIFWFPLSTLVFAHKEKVSNKLSKFVLIIWMFLVLVLTSSYTASLASMLTVKRLEPTVTDVEELVRNGDYVGHHDEPFVKEMLIKRMKFDESKLKVFRSSDEYDEALSKGSRNGGVSAIFHETPYFRLFLEKHCKKYTLIGPTHRTGGFAFVFPKGSPVVPDISRAIIQVTEGDQMAKIEQAWFGSRNTCSDQSALVNTDSLTLENFRGLFLISGIASASSLFISFASFLYKNKHVLTSPDSRNSIWQKLLAIMKHFKEKDKSSTMPRRECSNVLVIDIKSSVSHISSNKVHPSTKVSHGHSVSF